ncbi:hypothetical protein DB30_04398 [Enhygromyxa salina]|uniref:Uncharacterized protein n=1 Tax=Enhygromyxa salina TaxID=215803 RepID=A0A0C2D451_9BACT|nr:hypothetical protein [Enhygromyxa salina]KIG16485.1 hypothetical protein DB30_04398 [Enhygromyxa salina]
MTTKTNQLDPGAVAPASSFDLAGHHRLEIRRTREGGESDTVELFNHGGAVMVVIELSERGPILRFEGPGLTLRATGELILEAERLKLRSEKGLDIETGGDLRLHADGDLHSTARIQTIRAELGDAVVEANDDVRIDGERVLVNCTTTTPASPSPNFAKQP